MRFIENGPDIPDDLLKARDEDRVVFICGAGVSMGPAGLPNFIKLAHDVIGKIGAVEEDVQKALALINHANDSGAGNLVAIDQIFTLLERYFDKEDVEQAVAEALRPNQYLPDGQQEIDLSAHKTILDLSSTSNGCIQLVTTNFDRLFNDCNPDLGINVYPGLPTPSKATTFQNVTYLHGIVNEGYTGAEGEGFVLSSSSFGNAYLVNGFAREFLHEIIKRYVVVFIGYRADDPPVKYLLEGLKGNDSKQYKAYAFQDGDTDQVKEAWKDKDVECIRYVPDNNHIALWGTLNSWVERGKDFGKWARDILDKAKEGPKALSPFERSQVAHVVSSYEGAKILASMDEPIPAEWLCVFDQTIRYGEIGYTNGSYDNSSVVDPLSIYRLIDDITPVEIKLSENEALYDLPKRGRVPESAWSVFDLTTDDEEFFGRKLKDEFKSIFNSHGPNLPKRLWQISLWISKVSKDPTALWWGCRKWNLHPDVQRAILRNSHEGENAGSIKTAWRYLFNGWHHHHSQREVTHKYFPVQNEISDWPLREIRELSSVFAPYIQAKSRYQREPIPRTHEGELTVSDLLELEVIYNGGRDNSILEIDYEPTIAERRKLLIHALELEEECGRRWMSDHLDPIHSSLDKEDFDYYEKLLNLVMEYAKAFSNLASVDIEAARVEYDNWPQEGHKYFIRIRVWCAGLAGVLTIDEAYELLIGLQSKHFWNYHFQSDLLISVRERWDEFSRAQKQSIEGEIVSGPSNLDETNEEWFEKYKANSIVKYGSWLQSKGLDLSQDFSDKISELKVSLPEWDDERIEEVINTADNGRHRIARVHVADDNPDILRGVPLYDVIKVADEHRGKGDGFLIEREPFEGFIKKEPIQALRALMVDMKLGNRTEWAWRLWFNKYEICAKRKIVLFHTINQLMSFTDDFLVELKEPVFQWISSDQISKNSSQYFPDLFQSLLVKLSQAIASNPEIGGTYLIEDGKDKDWTMAAINSPAGKLAQALMRDSQFNSLKADNGLPEFWRTAADSMLLFEGAHRKYVIVVLAYRVDWLYYVDAKWTKVNLLNILDSEDQNDKDAFWAGFLWRANVPNNELYQLIKPHIIELAVSNNSVLKKYDRILPGLVMVGWNSLTDEKQRFISDLEFRTLLLKVTDQFRQQLLWQISSWSKEPSDEDESSIKWPASLGEFFTNVWPKQKYLKSPEITSALCQIVLSFDQSFTSILDAIYPFLTEAKTGDTGLWSLARNSKNPIIVNSPEPLLGLLYKVLPEDVELWPYGVQELFPLIISSQPKLAQDDRLIELQRRWDAQS